MCFNFFGLSQPYRIWSPSSFCCSSSPSGSLSPAWVNCYNIWTSPCPMILKHWSRTSWTRVRIFHLVYSVLTWFRVCKVILTSWMFVPVRLHGSSSGGPAWERSHRWTHVSQFTQCFTSSAQRSGSNALHQGFCQHWLMVLFYSVWVA